MQTTPGLKVPTGARSLRHMVETDHHLMSAQILDAVLQLQELDFQSSGHLKNSPDVKVGPARQVLQA